MKPKPIKHTTTWRKTLALVLMIGSTLIGLIQGIQFFNPDRLIQYIYRNEEIPIDTVERTERRLNCLVNELPLHEEIGFISGLDGQEHVERLRQTQYALVPYMVVDSDNTRLVIKYPNGISNTQLLSTNQYRPLLECGGVTLYEKLNRP